MSYQVISTLSQPSSNKRDLVWFRQKMTKLWPMKMDWSCKSLVSMFLMLLCGYLKMEQKPPAWLAISSLWSFVSADSSSSDNSR